MEIITKQEGSPYIFALEGRLDTNTAPQLEEFANGLYDKGVTDIEVDMSACEFVSSAGLRVIVAMQKRAAVEGSLVFRDTVPDVLEVFEITGFNNILTLE